MSDGPPAHWDQAPPASGNYGASASRGAQPQRGTGGWQDRSRPAVMAPEEIAAAAAGFYEWLNSPTTRADLATMLPGHITVDTFIATAKQAVVTKPALLAPALRGSLLTACSRAAGQGLLPDGKQGALVTRWDRDAGGDIVVWQPMVWGIVSLGYKTGAIKSIHTAIVFHGEEALIDETSATIQHIRDAKGRRIVAEAYGALHGAKNEKGKIQVQPDEFFNRIDFAYCVITATNGAKFMRWMPAERIALVRNASPAKGGPWNGPFIDEMVAKSLILWTCKTIDLDLRGRDAERFQAALETDLRVDFDALPASSEQADTPSPALIAPPNKLDGLEMAIGLRPERELAPVDGGASTGKATATATHFSAGPHGAPPPDEDPPPELSAAETAALRNRASAAVKGFSAATWEVVQKTTSTERYRSLIRDLTNAGMFDEMKRLADAVTDAKGREGV